MKSFLVILILTVPAFGMLYNIDQPTPVSLAHGEYYAGVRLWGAGGVMARFGVGLFNRLTLGMSYGGDKVIGSDPPEFYGRHRPEFQARLLILEEVGYIPDLLIGFESQGYDNYDRAEERYIVLEKGGYLCLGKTIDASRTYCQLGVNYWKKADGYIAINQLLPANLEVMLEYDPALNDDADKGRGFLNFGLAWTFNEQLRLGVALRDILGNRYETELNRVFDLSFTEHF